MPSETTAPATIPPAPSTNAPDWTAIHQDVLCPLCQYNLRSLTHPRCPECGYQFQWPEVLDTSRRLHPYLFEQHPNPRGFLRTLLATWWLWTFWRTLAVTHTPRPRRLLIYWAMMTLPALLAGALVFVWACHSVTNQQRSFMEFSLRSPTVSAQLMRSVSRAAPGRFPTTQSFIDALYPKLGPFDSVARVVAARSAVTGPNLATPALTAHMVLFALLAVWPWLSYAALTSLVASMRRHRIQNVHVLRCVLYSCDFGLWVALVMVGWSALVLYAASTPATAMAGAQLAPYQLAIVPAAIILEIIFAVRLAVAYRQYLRFDHPRTTIALMQLAQFLVVVCFLKQVPYFDASINRWLTHVVEWFRHF